MLKYFHIPNCKYHSNMKTFPPSHHFFSELCFQETGRFFSCQLYMLLLDISPPHPHRHTAKNVMGKGKGAQHIGVGRNRFACFPDAPLQKQTQQQILCFGKVMALGYLVNSKNREWDEFYFIITYFHQWAVEQLQSL